MLRTQVVKLTRATPSLQRSFTVNALRAAEGSTGGTRSGGVASSDAFSKREAASENKFIREKERESLKKLKEKLQAQSDHMKQLQKDIEELESQAKGEH